MAEKLIWVEIDADDDIQLLAGEPPADMVPYTYPYSKYAQVTEEFLEAYNQVREVYDQLCDKVYALPKFSSAGEILTWRD